MEFLGEVLAEQVLEFFNNAAAREMSLGNEGWQGRERVLRKEVFIG